MLPDIFFLTGLFLHLRRTTDTQDSTDIGAVDDGGGTTFRDQRERLTRHRSQSYSHHHVEGCLYDEEEGKTHHQEGGEVVLTMTRYSCRTVEQDDIQEGDGEGSQDT